MQRLCHPKRCPFSRNTSEIVLEPIRKREKRSYIFVEKYLFFNNIVTGGSEEVLNPFIRVRACIPS
jgi:hypothetical protein